MTNLAYGVWENAQGSLLLIVHNANSPTDSEWEALVQAAASAKMGGNRGCVAFVVSAGGGPSVVQRRRLVEVVGGRPIRSAVVSDRAVIRGVITAFSWLGLEIASFAPERSLEALGYLGLSEAQAAPIARELQGVGASVGSLAVLDQVLNTLGVSARVVRSG